MEKNSQMDNSGSQNLDNKDYKVLKNETNNQININQNLNNKNCQKSQNEVNNQTNQIHKNLSEKDNANISEGNLSSLNLFWKAIYNNLFSQILKYS